MRFSGISMPTSAISAAASARAAEALLQPGSNRPTLAIEVLAAAPAWDDKTVPAHAQGVTQPDALLVGRVAMVEPAPATHRTESPALVRTGAVERAAAGEAFGRLIPRGRSLRPHGRQVFRCSISKGSILVREGTDLGPLFCFPAFVDVGHWTNAATKRIMKDPPSLNF